MFEGWQFTAPHEPLTRVTKDDPVAGENEVIVSTRAAGLCHSDVGFLEGTIDWMLAFTPIVLGHEVAGEIREVGPGVTDWKPGDRVSIAGLGLDAPGLVADGGFGETLVAKVDQLVRIPDTVDWVQAAAATDAGQTARHALRVGEVGPGVRVGIIGLGGLGLTAAKIAVLLGAEVYAVEVNEAAWPAGLEAGVKKVVHEAKELTDLSLDVFVDYAGFGVTTAQAIAAVKDHGTVVQVGMGRTDVTIDSSILVSKQVTLVGSLGGSYADCEDVLRLMSEGLTVEATEIGFDEIPEGLDRLEKGGVRGRLVAVYPGS
jgi:2-desacetyl-2-hydroxyethyl bacteriochlorophyllide A dehydrogenase